MSVAKRVTGDARYHSPLAHLRSSLRNNVGFAKFSSNQHNTRNRRTKKTKNKKNRNQNETKWVRIVKLSDWHTCIRDSLKMLSLYTRKIFDSHTQWCTARLPILLSLTCSSSLSPSLSLFVVVIQAFHPMNFLWCACMEQQQQQHNVEQQRRRRPHSNRIEIECELKVHRPSQAPHNAHAYIRNVHHQNDEYDDDDV